MPELKTRKPGRRKKLKPLQFDLGSILQKARKLSGRHVDGVSINLPFISLSVKPNDIERRIANEVVIRLADRRVLSARECCDNCIDEALGSLQGIRQTIVDKQVELYGAKDGALYLLLEMMAEALRQFLTFEQRLNKLHREPAGAKYPDSRRAPEAREAYFTALETLRGHCSRCLLEIAHLGDVTLPKVGVVIGYDTPWPVEAYKPPELPSR